MDKLNLLIPPDRRQMELLKLEKDLEQIETMLLSARRSLRAIITGNRKGKGPKVVTIDMGNGKSRDVKCGTLGE